MSYGLPVIASSASCLPEIYGNAALYASPNEPTAWLEIVKKVRYDTVLQEDMRKKGLARVKQFDWTAGAKETLDILISVAKRP